MMNFAADIRHQYIPDYKHMYMGTQKSNNSILARHTVHHFDMVTMNKEILKNFILNDQ